MFNQYHFPFVFVLFIIPLFDFFFIAIFDPSALINLYASSFRVFFFCKFFCNSYSQMLFDFFETSWKMEILNILYCTVLYGLLVFGWLLIASHNFDILNWFIIANILRNCFELIQVYVYPNLWVIRMQLYVGVRRSLTQALTWVTSGITLECSSDTATSKNSTWELLKIIVTFLKLWYRVTENSVSTIKFYRVFLKIYERWSEDIW